MAQATQIKSKIQLLVEGKDQRNFFAAFIKRKSLGNIQVQNFGGVNELPKFLLGFVKMPDFTDTVQSIGIVRDAEECHRSAFQSVQNSLRNANLPIPDKPEERTGENLLVTVLILPGRNRPGMLETLLCESFSDTPENRCVDDFFKCVTTNSSNVPIRKPEKARARAYLTTKPEPHFSVGVAAKRGYWDLDHDTFAGVRGFLEKITSIESQATTG